MLSPPIRQRATRILAAALLLTGLALAMVDRPAAAETGYGTAVGYTTRTDGGHTVTGSGTWGFTGGNSVTVVFECTSAANTPGGTGAGIQPPAYKGCYLERNGSIVAYANGVHVPASPLAITANTASIPFVGTTSLRVCWNTYSTFVDGYIVSTAGCSSISVIDSIPDPPELDLSTSENKDPYGFIWAIGTQGQDEGYRLVCVSVGGNTHNCGLGVSTTGSSSTNAVSVSGTGPANSTCTVGQTTGGCQIGAVAVSGTGPAGTADCSKALVAVSATNHTCGTLAITGTGNAAGDYAVSGTGYAAGNENEVSGRETACAKAGLLC